MKREYKFGAVSIKHRDECTENLQLVLNLSIKSYNFSVICGHRDEVTQNKAYASGFSKLRFPNSKHNSKPSRAFDIYPYHPKYGALTGHPSQVTAIANECNMTYIEIENFITQEFCIMSGVIRAAAAIVGVPLVWGGDWDGDGDRLDQRFDDLSHFEEADI